jgi:DNA-binding XRE family transcriptional regulator
LDNQEIGRRLAEVRRTLKLIMREFAKRLNISNATVTSMELGKRLVKGRTLALMLHEFDVDAHWILTGEGEMFARVEGDTFEKACSSRHDSIMTVTGGRSASPRPTLDCHSKTGISSTAAFGACTIPWWKPTRRSRQQIRLH